MNNKHTQQPLYIIFWIIIAILLGLIGWFTYVLIKPNDSSTDPAQTNSTTDNTNTTTEKNSKKKKNSNTDTTNGVANANTNTAADSGLVEPSDSADETATEATADADKKTVTLYFPKSADACGEVYPVERQIEPSDDIYGQIILETMYGPTETESDYTSAVPSDMYLRRVEYTADGAVITVNEAYDSLDNCAQETVTAQLVETANAMFELPAGTAGEVVVGTVTDDETATDTTEDSANTTADDTTTE